MASPPENDARFRWQSLFQHAAEPLFLLNRRRRILFVNRAWETLTGLPLTEVKGQVCRRRPRGILAEQVELLLGALAPPPEVVQGQPGQARRLVALGTVPTCWQVAFFPLAGADGLVGILGKITVLAGPEVLGALPLSEKMLALRQRHLQHHRLEEMIGAGPVMDRLREQIRLAAQAQVPVLLQGAPGTGKHWVARAIHLLGPQREKPFARLDCAHLPAPALESLLLGATAPFAFVYLQNVAALPRDIQERLQARLEMEDLPPLRLCAGVAEGPEELVQTGKLLQGLYCRLSALVLKLPPLNERREDFDAWIERFLPRANRAAERQVRGVSLEASQLLRTHSWPGNLRELYEVLVAACLRAKGERIEPGDLPYQLRQGPLPEIKPLSLDAILEQVERRLIVHALRLANSNKSRAAELLTIWRARLLRRMENLEIKDQ